MLCSNKKNTWWNRNNLDYVDSVWQETTVKELKALFGIKILMSLNPLPQYKLHWHHNDFIDNNGVKNKTNDMQKISKS